MKFGVEGGGLAGIGAVVSSGPSSLNIGPVLGGFRGGSGLSLPGFVSEGPVRSFTSLANLGSELTAPSIFVNEAPARLENTMPYQLGMFNPVGSIKFAPPSNKEPVASRVSAGPQYNILDEANKLAEVAWSEPVTKAIQTTQVLETATSAKEEPEVAQRWAEAIPKTETVAVPDGSRLAAVREIIKGFVSIQVQPDVMTLFSPAPALEPVIEPKNVLNTQVVSHPQVETKAAQVVQTDLEPVLGEQQLREFVEEGVFTDRSAERLENHEEEGEEELRLSHSVSEKVLEKRENAIRKAAMKVEAKIVQAESTEVPAVIDGRQIVEEVEDKQSIIYRGEELNRIDPRGRVLDGGWEANLSKINSAKFNSVADVFKQTPKILAEDPPIVEGEGEAVTNENVAISLKYIPEAIHPAHIVFKRVVRKEKRVKIIKNGSQPAQIIPIEEKIVERNESTLHPELAKVLLAA